MKYYEIRLQFIKKLFTDHRTDLLQKNIDKIKAIVDGYNGFKYNPAYNPILAEFPQTFIL